VDPQLKAILDEARAQVARGVEPDADALAARIRDVVAPGGGDALRQLDRLLAVHRAKRSIAEPPQPAPGPRPRQRVEYRARPTIAANMAVRARAAGEAVVLEWDARPGVSRWEARLSERRDARSPYVDRETFELDAPRLEVQLTDLPQRVALVGRTATGRIVQRALISGLTSSNWSQRWQQRPSAS
jgi:hypothetical protein